MSKLDRLCDIEGLTLEELLEAATFDSASPGICMNAGCDYTTEVEPDCRAGWCEECNMGSVRSGLSLAGCI